MSLIRFTLDLAIPEETYKLFSTAVKTDLMNTIRWLKGYAVKINEGLPSEEATVRAVWHRCHHDTGGDCEPENEI